MVSIENRYSFFDSLKEPKVLAFQALLELRDYTFLVDTNSKQTDDIYYVLIKSLIDDDKQSFQFGYEKLLKRTPNKDNPLPFINDDYLIFAALLGAMKYKLDTKWIQQVLDIRKRTSTTITFDNIVKSDFYSNSNSFAIVTCFFHLIEYKEILKDFINEVYRRIVDRKELTDGKDTFLTIITYKAYDISFGLKDLNSKEYSELKIFEKKFIKRTGIIRYIIFNLFLLYALYKSSQLNFQDQRLQTVATILGICGFGILGNFIPFGQKLLFRIILFIFGYPNDKINEIIEKK